MMPVRHQVLLRLLLACALPLLAAPGHAAAQFALEKVVELSRHGIRPPTEGNREAIEAATQRPWTQWTTRDGEPPATAMPPSSIKGAMKARAIASSVC